MAKIRSVVVEGDRQSGYKRVQVLFGTNYFLEIVENQGRVDFLLGAHHTGFKADASELEGKLKNLSAKSRSGIPTAHWSRSSQTLVDPVDGSAPPLSSLGSADILVRDNGG